MSARLSVFPGPGSTGRIVIAPLARREDAVAAATAHGVDYYLTSLAPDGVYLFDLDNAYDFDAVLDLTPLP